MELFEIYHTINNNLTSGNDIEARNELIKLLDYFEKEKIEYPPILNHLIRATGLYPYIKKDTATWQDKWVYELFKVNVGGNQEATLHREQSMLLKKLLEGHSLAVSAPTSFGKSFVIDAFISIKQPSTIVIIVPTIALTDETRRRLQNKFGHEYKIITTPEIELADKNILIFPQERAINYQKKLKSIDILIIDEFYKASINFDKERAPILLKTILELGKISKQRYFLAPNISKLIDSPFTVGMEFISLDFNTVYTEKHNYYRDNPDKDNEIKARHLTDILSKYRAKTLIYAGTFVNIDFIANTLDGLYMDMKNDLLHSFSDWLRENYHPEYILAKLVKKGVGIHNGQLHRSLSQIQVRLFEEPDGLDNMISTSSIIEGVNTSAENVIIWANKNGKPPLNDFTYKNIIGRGGRMFRHFIGKVYLLEEPPQTEATQLNLEFTDDLLTSLDEEKHKDELTREQIIKIIAFKEEMDSMLGDDVYMQMIQENPFQSFNSNKIKFIAYEMSRNPASWSGLGYLNSDNPNLWEQNLYKVLRIMGQGSASYRDMVAYVKAISNNWNKPIAEIIRNLRSNGITIEKFFELERVATFKLTSILTDINNLQKKLLPQYSIDIRPFIAKLSHAFLPPLVYLLEEYGLPRMVSKKIHISGVIDLERTDIDIIHAISIFRRIGSENLQRQVNNLSSFDKYIIDYFYEGIKENTLNL